MNNKTLLLLWLAPVSRQAQMYKSVVAHGNTVYGDTPYNNAEEFIIPLLNTMPMPHWQHPTPVEGNPPFKYSKFRIVAPSNEQTLFINTGNVQVNICLQRSPALRFYLRRKSAL